MIMSVLLRRKMAHRDSWGEPAAATALKSPTKPPRSPHKAASKWHDQDEAKHDKEQEHARAAQAHANDGDDPEKEHRQRMEAPPDAADSWAGAADAEALSSGLSPPCIHTHAHTYAHAYSRTCM